MKIAYLILAHAHPEHLGRLIDRLAGPGVAFFVHLDERSDKRRFEVEARHPAVFLRRRVPIHWTGFSMVQATFFLLEEAFAAGADRFVLLSGVDYPLATNAEIRSVLSQDKEHIQVDMRLDPEGTGHFDRCASRWFFGDFAWCNPRSGHPRWQKLAEDATLRLPPRRYRFPVYYGASWWALTRAAVAHLLDRRTRRSAMAFRFARSPDEMVFQSLVKAGPRASQIAFDRVDRHYHPPAHRQALHYVNWERANPSLPATLESPDFDELLASGALFARKIDPERSRELLDLIDRHRQRDEVAPLPSPPSESSVTAGPR